MINLDLSTYNMLSAIPDSFTVTVASTTETATITITIDSTAVYSTTLFAYSSTVTFYEFRDLLKQYMLSNQLSFATLSVTATYDSTTETSDSVYVLFSEYSHEGHTASEFITYSFLTTRTYKRLPRTATESISLFSVTASESCYADCVFSTDDGNETERVLPTLSTTGTAGIYSVDVSPTTIAGLATSTGTLLSFTLHVEDRSITYFVSDIEPEIAFTFHNGFNIEENVYVYGTTKFITTFDSSEAISLGKTRQYNKSKERRNEVTTELLTLEEANWYNELFNSDYIYVDVEGTAMRVLINDVTSEISDSASETVRMKFTWFFDDNALYTTISTPSGIFTSPFTAPYS